MEQGCHAHMYQTGAVQPSCINQRGWQGGLALPAPNLVNVSIHIACYIEFLACHVRTISMSTHVNRSVTVAECTDATRPNARD